MMHQNTKDKLEQSANGYKMVTPPQMRTQVNNGEAH
jgi:hypothetical protein